MIEIGWECCCGEVIATTGIHIVVIVLPIGSRIVVVIGIGIGIGIEDGRGTRQDASISAAPTAG